LESNHIFTSQEFDDIYFSKEDGVEETKYVFLSGNHIPERWISEQKSDFRIGELGFGTGLNYFVTLDEWENIQNPPNVIFYSLEKFPIQRPLLLKMNDAFPELSTWNEDLLDAYCHFLQLNPEKETTSPYFIWSSPHPLSQNTFTLKLFLGDVVDAIQSFTPPIDCFYLDGFAPKKNPEMWTEDVMLGLRKLSVTGTTFSTFTAAGFVKRNLKSVGFEVNKQSGFGRKREMLVGKLIEQQPL
jgi:tRNA 5-methylaminomethyl-2-thiouridine biosynthesis bifunctional protein